MWVYINSEPGLWTVGFYDPNGHFHAESDHDDEERAAERVHYLNGGSQQAESKTDDRAERIVAQMIFAGYRQMIFDDGRFVGYDRNKGLLAGCGAMFSFYKPEDRAEAVKMVALSLQAGHVYEEVQ